MNNKPKVCIVGNMITLPYSPDHSGIIQGLQILKDKEKISDYFIADISQHQTYGERAIIETIVNGKPDLVIHGMTDSLSQEWPRFVKERLPNVIQVMSMWDYRPDYMNYDGFWSKWIESGRYLDLITLSNKNQLKWWAKDFGAKTMYWPHGCVVKSIEYDSQYEFDTVFVGSRNESTPYNERVKLIDAIDRLTPVKWVNEGGGDSNSARIGIWKDLGKIYGSAKTTLDISHFWDADGYASGRYFYTSGLGGCAIAKRFPGCEELFPEGTKIYFDTPEEAMDKIKYYLNHNDEREKIKIKGKEWANKYHSYEVRFLELFNWFNL